MVWTEVIRSRSRRQAAERREEEEVENSGVSF